MAATKQPIDLISLNYFLDPAQYPLGSIGNP